MDRESTLQFICLAALAGMYLCLNKRRPTEQGIVRRRNRRWWVRPIYVPAVRASQGVHDNLLREMRLSDPGKYTKWTRMTPAMFDKLLSLVGPNITKQRIARAPIDPCTKLEITLRYVR